MPEYPVASLSIENIRLDGGTQTRAGLQEDTLEEYTNRLKEDPEFNFPPADVFDDGVEYWMADGFHRHQAYYRAGRETMPCRIQLGERREALQYALSANVSHGLRRSSADKLRALEIALADPEWREWSNYELADLCGVSEAFVRSHRPDFDSSLRLKRSDAEKTASQNSQPEPPTPEQTVAEEQPAPPKKRKFKTRSGKTTTMRTERIGRKQKASASTDAEESPSPETTEPAPGLSANGSVTDAVGLPVPEPLLRVFQERKLFAELHRLRKELADRLDHLAKSPGGLHLLWKLSHRQTQGQSSYRWRPLDQLKALLRDSEPCCCLCPSCHRKHPGMFDPECEQCYGHGWIPHGTWKQIPDEDRHEVEALVPASE